MDYAVVGTGYWGENHVRVAAELAEEGMLDSVVLCDVDEEKVRDLADTHGVAYTTDHTELPELGVDAATVATPSPTHHAIGTDLLSSGLDLLVEKPLALTSEEAWALQETAEDHDRTLAVGHIFRYHPALRELRRRIDRGALGDIKYLRTARTSFRVPRRTAGALYSLAVHDIDIYNLLLDGLPDYIYCNLDRFVREEVDETASLVLDYGGATGVINESWQVPAFDKRRDLVVVGSERCAYVDYLADNEFELFDARVERENGHLRAVQDGTTCHTVPDEEPLKVEVGDFVHSIRTGTTPLAPGRVGAETVELLELAERSDELGTAIPVDQYRERGSRVEA